MDLQTNRTEGQSSRCGAKPESETETLGLAPLMSALTFSPLGRVVCTSASCDQSCSNCQRGESNNGIDD